MKQFNLEEYLKNPEKRVVTRDGRSARIICTDAKGKHPIIALIDGKDGSEVIYCFNGDGRAMKGTNNPDDLFFLPEKHEGWMHIYKHIDGHCEGDGIIYNTKEQCEVNQSSRSPYNFRHVAIAKIEWEE